MPLTESEALAIARARATEKNWGLVEPLAIELRRPWIGSGGRFEIQSNPLLKGTRVRFTIDFITGEIISEGYITR